MRELQLHEESGRAGTGEAGSAVSDSATGFARERYAIMFRSAVTALALATTLLAGAAPAAAQAYPPYAFGPPRAGFGDRTYADRYHVQGFVTQFGGFNLMLNVRGGSQPVNLHQGTVLRPRGLTMSPGMLVRCDGYFNGNGLFIAERITLVG